MDDAELNRAVAAARGKKIETIGRIDWIDEGGGYMLAVPNICTDPAAWGGLLEELAAQNTTPSLHRGPSLAHNTVEWFATVYNTYGTPQHAHDPKPGRALALAFLASKGVSTD